MTTESRPENLPRHREFLHRAGASSFATFVPYETVLEAGFNYWEPSIPIYTEAKQHAIAHVSHIDDFSPEGLLNLVVIRDLRTDNNRDRVDWYFGTFTGKHRGETETEEETEMYDQQVAHILSRHHRVAGSELNALIRNAAGLD